MRSWRSSSLPPVRAAAPPTSVRWGLGLKPHWLQALQRHCVQVLKLGLPSPVPIRSVVLQTAHSWLLGMGAICGTEYGDVGTLRSGEAAGDLPVLLPPTSTCRFLRAAWPPCSPWGAAGWWASWEASRSPVPGPLWTPVLGPASDTGGLVETEKREKEAEGCHHYYYFYNYYV